MAFQSSMQVPIKIYNTFLKKNKPRDMGLYLETTGIVLHRDLQLFRKFSLYIKKISGLHPFYYLFPRTQLNVKVNIPDHCPFFLVPGKASLNFDHDHTFYFFPPAINSSGRVSSQRLPPGSTAITFTCLFCQQLELYFNRK